MSDLLKINVGQHIEKKNGLSYLSWAWAWAEVLKIDPLASWQAHEWNGLPAMFLPDGSAMVKVSVTIKGDTKACPLPVMDHRNKAIKNPDAFAINTATMRALAKAISMHGLGLYIYAGEDLPEQDDKAKKELHSIGAVVTDEKAAELDEVALYMIDCHKNGNDLDAIRVYYELPDNEAKAYVWQQLKAESKLRSTVKANSPHKEAA